MPILVKEGSKVTYLYLCGIKPAREIKLGDGITLIPAKANPAPDDMIDCIMKSNHASEFELGVLISTLRMTTSQIRIEDNSLSENLAVKTWNTQQICVQMCAILNCDIAWYFQSDRPVEKFDSKTDIHMIINNMYKTPDIVRDLSLEECLFLEERIEKAMNLADANRQFYLATNAMWSYRMNFMPAIKICVIWSGIEAMFMVKQDIKNTIATVSSRFIYGNDNKINEIKKLYREARCKATHEYQNGADNCFNKSNELLYNLILKSIETGCTPNVSLLMHHI